MKVNVVYNKNVADWSEALQIVESVLISGNIEFNSYNIDNMQNFGKITIVIGGDGTLLKAAKFYSEQQIPVLGINLGRLGFLSQARGSIKDIVENIINEKYFVKERMMLISDNNLALNDFVIKGCDPSRTSKFYLEIDGKEVSDYIADGLIISTSTGSTAYGLSAGGPVIHPSLDVLTIVPICPHTLTSRPLVVPCTEVITVKTEDRLLSVAIDGFDTTKCIEKITIRAAKKKALLAFLEDENFYSVLRDKLHWGISPVTK